ncbi:MAG TPA: MlaD family protein [Solirubrobacteraceae bacterium]|nr:MlaD family protein [Solirubrobacteraceae bacterium]
MHAGESSHEGLSVRDQIERYRTAFISVVTMIVIAAAVGGYILAHENLKLPGWVPVLGRNYYTLKAEFETAQAVTPGQGQAVTIAGAKVGEIQSVELHNGVAVVSMRITPKYAHFYRNATLLLRPKTQLQDITVEVNPGTPAAGKLKSGEVLPQSQTAPNIDFDEFLAGLDAETRAYLQLLLAGAAGGFKNNSAAFSATVKRFAPLARYGQEIASQVEIRHANIARSIHNFRLLTEALGTKDTEIAQLVDASNAVFQTFAKEEANLQKTLRLLPGALAKTGVGLGKLARASDVLGPTLHDLLPFAKALAPAQEASTQLAKSTTPIIKNDIRPFAREILPVVNQLGPSTEGLAESLPKLATSFKVLNEFFNELAYNPGKSKNGFLFFLPWANHDLNSVVSTSDAHGPVGRSLVYFNCEVLPLLTGVSEINPNVNLLVGLLKPPTKAECQSEGILKASAVAASARSRSASTPQGIFGGLSDPFGGAGALPSGGHPDGRGQASAKAATSAKPASGSRGGGG